MQLKDLALPAELESRRTAFLNGVKAAFVVSQMNRLGQVLCSGCGSSFSGSENAFEALELCNVLGDGVGRGYEADRGWGVDNPNNLKLCCRRCLGRR